MIEAIDTSKEAVRKTGRAFLIVGIIISAVVLWKHGYDGGHGHWELTQALAAQSWRWFLGLGTAIAILSYSAYGLMKHFHVAWMTFAQYLGWFMTRVILSIFFYLVITPVGLLMRAFGKDLLDMKIDKSAPTYWKKRDVNAFDPKHITRTF